MFEENQLVAVYGSLRVNQYNYYNLGIQNQEYKGQHILPAKYEMRSFGSFPALSKGGKNTAVVDVFEVDPETMMQMDQLEGHTDHLKYGYHRELIDTPWGKAWCYFYNGPLSKSSPVVESGDWVKYNEELYVTQ